MPGANEDLAGDQMGHEGARVVPEAAAAAHEIVLVAAETGTSGIEVVLEHVDATGHPPGGQAVGGPLGEIGHDQLPGPVLGQEIGQAITLGGGELRVAADVEIEAGPSAGKNIGGTSQLHDGIEELASGVVGVQGRRTARGRGAGDAVLRLDADDPPRRPPRGRHRH